MDLTTRLTGELPAIMIVATVLTAIVSAWLLWLYRRATLRGMARFAGVVDQPKPRADNRDAMPAPRAPLTITTQPDGQSAAPIAAYRRTARAIWSSAAVYAVGGFVYALVLALPWSIVADPGFYPIRILFLVLIFTWPTVLVINLTAATDRRETLLIAGGYALVAMIVGWMALRQIPGLGIRDLLFLWLWANGPATILSFAFLRRRVRAVGPLVFAFMLLGVTGAFLTIDLAAASESVLRGFVVITSVFGLGALSAFLLLHLVGYAILGLLGWWLLLWIGRQYRSKRLSDQSIIIDALWLTFAVAQTFTLALEGWGWIFTGLVAFAAYKLVTRTGFTWLRKRSAQTRRAPMLLLLRVFALGHRSEQFFDAFSLWWLRAGSISLIAGPDLVTTTVAPHEFLDFVGGRLSRRFVSGAADLEQRLTILDRQPDPDGRHRVNEFFCHADTWQMTMRRLAEESDAVLMDLRSFSEANQGCLYELEQLLDIVDLERVVFLVDDSTDRPFLANSLERLWAGVDRASPNRNVATPTARLFHVTDRSRRSITTLLLMLLGRRTPTPDYPTALPSS